VNPVRNSRGALNLAGIILKSNPATVGTAVPRTLLRFAGYRAERAASFLTG